MILSLKGQLADWKYARGNTIQFLKQLTDEELNKQLPRKTFVTIYEQIVEMAWVQRCFLKAIDNKTLDGMDWTAPTFATKDELLEQMAQFDKKMEQILENCNGTEEINWFDHNKNINEHISAMQSHEMMHLGQIIAFCHALDINIPQEVTKSMHLTG
ncbi:MAG: DinB family protein [Defluviitaleaceae bacterium]|nr:DinB family protein [Defluviitaleaceae bacterium]